MLTLRFFMQPVADGNYYWERNRREKFYKYFGWRNTICLNLNSVIETTSKINEYLENSTYCLCALYVQVEGRV